MRLGTPSTARHLHASVSRGVHVRSIYKNQLTGPKDSVLYLPGIVNVVKNWVDTVYAIFVEPTTSSLCLTQVISC